MGNGIRKKVRETEYVLVWVPAEDTTLGDAHYIDTKDYEISTLGEIQKLVCHRLKAPKYTRVIRAIDSAQGRLTIHRIASLASVDTPLDTVGSYMRMLNKHGLLLRRLDPEALRGSAEHCYFLKSDTWTQQAAFQCINDCLRGQTARSHQK